MQQQALIDAPIDTIVVGASAAGSGKTHTMLGRAKKILSDYQSGKVMLISFTRAAAQDLKDRLKEVLDPEDYSRVTSGTFHSVLGQIIRDQAVNVGLNPNFSIIDEQSTIRMYRRIFEQYIEQDDTIKETLERIYKDKQTDDKPLKAKHFTQMAHDVSLLVNNCDPKELITGNFGGQTAHRLVNRSRKIDGFEVTRVIPILYQAFKDSLINGRKNNVVNYDHILFIAYLMGTKGMLESIKQQYINIMVDEFQDSNAIQIAITHFLAGDHLTVIGDVDQSIYAFRGGRPDLMEEISKKATVINLPTNYRSYQPILDLGNKVITLNQMGKDFRAPMVAAISMDEQFGGIKWAKVDSDFDEADMVIAYIKALRQHDIPYHEMAILVRSRMALPILNQRLANEDIPVNDTTKFADFMNSEVVVDILNFLKILTNPKDIYAFYNTLDRPKRGIGKVALETLEEKAKSHQMNLVEYILSEKIQELTPALKRNVMEYRQVYLDLIEHDIDTDLVTAIKQILTKSGYYNWAGSLANSERYLRHIDIFLDMANEFMEEFEQTHEEYTLHDIASSFVFEMANSAKTETPDGVCISTIHSAKGLEWDYVFLLGMEKGIFPMCSDDNLEDERRLFYVAITRAKKGLILSSSKERVTIKNNDQTPLEPSIFMHETGLKPEQIRIP